MRLDQIEIGKEYDYLGQPVKVERVDEWGEVFAFTRCSEPVTCQCDALTARPILRRKRRARNPIVVIRCPADRVLFDGLHDEARQQGVSLNSWCIYKLSQDVEVSDAPDLPRVDASGSGSDGSGASDLSGRDGGRGDDSDGGGT